MMRTLVTLLAVLALGAAAVQPVPPAIEDLWTVEDLGKARLNVLVGFPLGGVLSVCVAACAAVVLLPLVVPRIKTLRQKLAAPGGIE